MALFTTTAFAGGGSGGSSSENNDYEMRQLLIDQQYLDPDGNVLDSKYFDLSRKNAALALKSGVTAAKRVAIAKDQMKLNNDETKYNIENQTALPSSMEQVDTEINDVWKQLWSNKDQIKIGNFKAMANSMASAIDDERELLQTKRDEIAKNFNNPKRVAEMDQLLKYYDSKAGFYRGVVDRPADYGVIISRNSKGEINKVEIKIKVKGSGK